MHALTARLLMSLALLMPLTSLLADDDCERPWPVQLPADPPVDTELMLDYRTQVQQYLADAQAYLDCNKSRSDAAGAAIETTDDALVIQEHEQTVRSLVSRYNQTVDEMHAVGNRFNELLKAFKALHATSEESADEDG